MTISLAQNFHPQNIPHFKKHRLAQMITLTLSLVGYGVVNNSAYAQAQQLSCNVTTDIELTDVTENSTPCTIDATGTVMILNTSLNNYSQLTNDGGLVNESYAAGTSNLTNSGTLTTTNFLENDSSGVGSTSNLTNSGTLTNDGELYNESYAGGTSRLINEAGGGLTNTSYLHNLSDGANSTSTLTNSGTLTNQYNLHNESSYGGRSSLTNEANATLTNENYLGNLSEYNGTSTLTNKTGATLTNNAGATLNNESGYFSGSGTSTLLNSGTLDNYGVLFNDSYDGGNSRLINEAGGELRNTSYLYNRSDGAGSTSTLTNVAGATLTNEDYLVNSSDYNSTSTLTNKVGAVLINRAGATLNNESGYNDGSGTSNLTNEGNLTNNGYLDNVSYDDGTSTLDNTGTLTNNGNTYNNASITNSGTFDITTNGAMTNYGTFTQTAGTTIVNGDIFGSGSLDFQGGSLSGSGTIEAESITIGEDATVKPGNSPGTLIMVSDLELFGTLQTEIVSSIMGDYDVLEVQGTVTLSDDSLFDFFFDDSYVETDGDSFDFLTAFDFVFGSATDFDTWFDRSNFSITGLAAGFGWTVTDQNPNYLSLDIFLDGTVVNPDPNAVSAPGTLGLFGLSLALLGWSSRRRTKLRAHRV
jgi:hypothetical protein